MSAIGKSSQDRSTHPKSSSDYWPSLWASLRETWLPVDRRDRTPRPGVWSTGTSQGILELLAGALSENPKSIDHLATIVEHLRGIRASGSGRTPARMG